MNTHILYKKGQRFRTTTEDGGGAYQSLPRVVWPALVCHHDLLPENRSTDNWSPPVKQRRTACGGAGLRTSRSSGS